MALTPKQLKEIEEDSGGSGRYIVKMIKYHEDVERERAKRKRNGTET